MIPKKIHYCWLGGNPMPKSGRECIASWKKFFPDYEIIEWNESNYDIHSCAYVEEAYNAKKYAFVSDYIRLDVLYRFGGFYFDTDVEVIAPFPDILKERSWMGCEYAMRRTEPEKIMINPGVGMAAAAGLDVFGELLEYYQTIHFLNEAGECCFETVVTKVSRMFENYGFNPYKNCLQKFAEIDLYPPEYFSPINYFTGEKKITEKTLSIHHYAETWLSKEKKREERMYRRLYAEKKYKRGIAKVYFYAERMKLRVKEAILRKKGKC